MADREQLLEPIIASLRKGTQLSRQQILKELADWEAVPFTVAGEHLGSAIVKGTEMHFALIKKPAACTRGAIQAFVQPLLDRHGYLTTRIQLASKSSKRFVERIGFKPTWADTTFQYYLLGRLPFARS